MGFDGRGRIWLAALARAKTSCLCVLGAVMEANMDALGASRGFRRDACPGTVTLTSAGVNTGVIDQSIDAPGSLAPRGKETRIAAPAASL